MALIPTVALAKSLSVPATPSPVMPSIIEQFTANSRSLDRTYSLGVSHARMARLENFDTDELALLASLNFDRLAEPDKVDYLLLKNRVTSDLHRLAIQKKQTEEAELLLPFCETIESLLEDKRLMKRPDGEKAAAELATMAKRITAKENELDPKKHGKEPSQSPEQPKVDRVVANRAGIATDEFREALKDWVDQYNGYDPEFTWWADQPYIAPAPDDKLVEAAMYGPLVLAARLGTEGLTTSMIYGG